MKKRFLLRKTLKVGEEEKLMEWISVFMRYIPNDDQSSFRMEGNVLTAEIFFEEPPQEMIAAVMKLDPEEFLHGDELNTCITSITKAETNQADVTEQEEKKKQHDATPDSPTGTGGEDITSDDIPPVDEQNNTQTNDEKPPEKPKDQAVKKVEIEIPELANLAVGKDSYEAFLTAVAKWLELGGREKLFLKMVAVAAELETITWEKIFTLLTRDEIPYSENTDKQVLSAKVANKFRGSQNKVSIMKLIKILVKLKDFPFGTEPILIKPGESVEKRKMECMSDIPHFEILLQNMDVEKNTEERIKYVLDGIGLQKLDVNKQKIILQVALLLVQMPNLDVRKAWKQVSSGEPYHNQIAFATMLREYIMQYSTSKNKDVSTTKFLQELHKVVS